MTGDAGVSSGSGPCVTQVYDLKFCEFAIRQGSLQTDGQSACLFLLHNWVAAHLSFPRIFKCSW